MGLPSTVVGDHTGIVGVVCFFFLLFLFEIAYKKFLKSKLTSKRVRSSVVEHGIADPAVTGSTPVVP